MPLDRVDVDLLARRTAGLSGADLKALCQQAAVEALTRTSAAVAAADFDAALVNAAARQPPNPSPAAPAGRTSDISTTRVW